MPERPLLAPWYRLAYVDDGVLLEHGGSLVSFGGAAARRLLPVLLPVLDGTRTVDEVVAFVGRPAAPAVDNALDLLHCHGLLTEGPRLADTGRTQRAAVEQLVARSGGSETAVELASRLGESRVAVAGGGGLVDQLARLLQLSGIGTVVHASPEELPEVDFVLIAPEPRFPHLLTDWNARALEDRRTWLPVGGFDGRTATVGPLVVPHETACHECLLIRRASTSGSPSASRRLRRIPPTSAVPPALGAIVAALAAHATISWLALRDPSLPGTLVTVDAAAGLAVEFHSVLRVPRCPVCSPQAASAPLTPWHEATA
jgi:bacteriocin biosynthesis cyclodehydratase domain-containing protein